MVMVQRAAKKANCIYRARCARAPVAVGHVGLAAQERRVLLLALLKTRSIVGGERRSFAESPTEQVRGLFEGRGAGAGRRGGGGPRGVRGAGSLRDVDLLGEAAPADPRRSARGARG